MKNKYEDTEGRVMQSGYGIAIAFLAGFVFGMVFQL
jgi:hypothetical protein